MQNIYSKYIYIMGMQCLRNREYKFMFAEQAIAEKIIDFLFSLWHFQRVGRSIVNIERKRARNEWRHTCFIRTYTDMILFLRKTRTDILVHKADNMY